MPTLKNKKNKRNIKPSGKFRTEAKETGASTIPDSLCPIFYPVFPPPTKLGGLSLRAKNESESQF